MPPSWKCEGLLHLNFHILTAGKKKHFASCCGGLFWSYVYIAPLRLPPSQTGGADGSSPPPTPPYVRCFRGSAGATSRALSSSRQAARASKHTHGLERSVQEIPRTLTQPLQSVSQPAKRHRPNAETVYLRRRFDTLADAASRWLRLQLST